MIRRTFRPSPATNPTLTVPARVLLALAVFTCFAAPAPLEAQDRLVRRYGGEAGLQPSVVALAQDSVGFLWAGSRAGLFRYDGHQFQRWAADVLPNAVGSIAISPERVVVVDASGRIVELTPAGARELPGAALRSPDHTQVAAFDEGGRLWVATLDGGLAWLDDRGEWHARSPAQLQVDTVRKVLAGGPGGGVLVAGRAGLWRVTGQAPGEPLLETTALIVDATALPDGRILVLSSGRLVFEIRPDGRTRVLTQDADIPMSRAISLADRAGTIWMATDRDLIALDRSGTAEVLGPTHGVAGGGPLLIDREGSLWHAGFTVVSHYPEPGTRVWEERHGLPSAHTRFVARTGDVVWVTTWRGTGFLERNDGSWQAGTLRDWFARGQPCADGAGGVWMSSADGLRHLRGREARLVNSGTDLEIGSCRPASDGGFWISSHAGLHHMSGDGRRIRHIENAPYLSGDTVVEAVLEDRTGRLWIGNREQACHAAAADVLADRVAAWSCERLPPGAVHLNAFAEMPSGAIWAANSRLGVMHHTAAGWEPLPGNRDLPTRSVLNLVPSPRGGTWLVGTGMVIRVEEEEEDEGWEVLERLGAWHGLPTVGGGDLLEEEDGTLWITTAEGVILVPAEVRLAHPQPPAMAVVEARVDGRRVPLREPMVLPADRNRLELRFAALSFRDPGRIRYQVRLSPDEPWADTDGQPFFNWVDLPPGRHQPEVRASLDGEQWSPVPAGVAFRVLPPWYRTAWAISAFLLLGAALLFAIYRARIAYLLGLERQRTRIALDLHDEMGSGLASIGILADVLSSHSGSGNEIAREVAATAEELGTALSDIVWSLDPQSATLDVLAARMAENGSRLFADDVQLDTSFPGHWPADPLPLPVLRNVLLIGLEALHNAARHACARHVTLSLQPDGAAWLLTVCDDGIGMTENTAPRGSGRGLRGMRRRADEIGGEISWRTPARSGTEVRLRFDPWPARNRLAHWLLHGRVRPAASHTDPHEHAGASVARPVHR